MLRSGHIACPPCSSIPVLEFSLPVLPVAQVAKTWLMASAAYAGRREDHHDQ